MKATLRNRELFEAEASLKKLAELELKQKLAYAVAKNQRIIGNEAQDLRFSLQMKKEKHQATMNFEEKRQIILQDTTMDAAKKFQALENLKEEFGDIKFDIDNHTRETNEILKKETEELELFQMKLEWFPKNFPGNALGPMIVAITDGEEEDE